MIEVKVGPWNSGLSSAYLLKRGRWNLVMHIAEGESEKKALQNLAKELKRLAKEAEEKAKKSVDT